MMAGLLFVGSMAVFIRLIPSGVQRRSDMVYGQDKSTGRQMLVERPGTGTRSSGRMYVQTAALVLAGLLCVYGLTNRPANAVDTLALSGLQHVPARLVDCEHRWTSTTKGHDEIRSGVVYSFNGVAHTGRAESVEFHLFPTNARMNAQVARFMQSPGRTAYVDAQHPEFAIAYIDTAWLALYSFGIFEGIVALLLLLLLPFLLKDIVFAKN